MHGSQPKPITQSTKQGTTDEIDLVAAYTALINGYQRVRQDQCQPKGEPQCRTNDMHP